MENFYPGYQNMLSEIQSIKKPSFLAGKDVVIPRYDGYSLANIPASVCRWLGVQPPVAPCLSDHITHVLQDNYQHVLLLVVDGLRLDLFNQFITRVLQDEYLPTWKTILEEGTYTPLTSVCPSTTAAALTTLWTGAFPSQHGMIGYELFLKEFGCIANMITQSVTAFTRETVSLKQAGFQPRSFLPVPTLGGFFKENTIAPSAFQHFSIAKSGLSDMLLNDVERYSFRTVSDLWYSVSDLFENHGSQKTFTYVYWGELDSQSHRAGPNHDKPTQEWNIFAQVLSHFLMKQYYQQRKDTLFILTADHGQVATNIDARFSLKNHPDFIRHLIMLPSGESRLPYLFIQPGKEQQVANYLTSHWNGSFQIVAASDFTASGLLGTDSVHQKTLDRIGTHVAIPDGNQYWWWANKDNILKGRHGGLSPEEMLVPFFAVTI